MNDRGQVWFSQPPICCDNLSPASLWTPTVAQGTVGTTTTISTVYGLAQGTSTLNNFGQIGAYVNGSMGIWTPAAPNGTTGVFTPNTQLPGLAGMNGFGQAIVNSNTPLLFTPLLFTPLAAKGTVGTFTSIVGLAGATQNTLAAINAGGAVLGYSCVAQSSGACLNQGFVWTSAASNGISGTTVAMPMPPAFVTVTPTAFNSTGSVAGTLVMAARCYTLAIAAVNPCHLKDAGNVTVADVQPIINEVLGVAPVAYDLSGNGVVNVVDVQIEINAAVGLGCSVL